jgi:hypothetical protein
MARLALVEGKEVSMLQVFNPQNTKAMKQNVIRSSIEKRLQSKKTNIKEPKQYCHLDRSRRNNRLIKDRIKNAKGFQLFLTLMLPKQSEFNTPMYFNLCLSRFSSWFVRNYSSAFGDYWLELTIQGNLHCHANVHLGIDKINLKQFERECFVKWSSIVKCNDLKICNVKPFHIGQIGYVAKNSKRSRTLALLDMYQSKKTYGTWGKNNKTYIQAKIFDIDQLQEEQLANYFINKMRRTADKLQIRANDIQIGRIRSGFYSQLFLNEVDVGCVYVILFYNELSQMIPISSLGLSEDVWSDVPWGIPHVPVDELEGFFGYDEDNCFDLAA